MLDQLPRALYDLPPKTALLREFQGLKDDFPSLLFMTRSVLKAGKEQKFIFLEGNLPLAGEAEVRLRVIYGNEYPKACPTVHIVPRADEMMIERVWLETSGMVKTEFMKNWKKTTRNTAALLANLREMIEKEAPIEVRRESMANIGICRYSETHMTTKACICEFPFIHICSKCLGTHTSQRSTEKLHYLYDVSLLGSIQSTRQWENTYSKVEAVFRTITDLQLRLSKQVEESKRALNSTMDLLITAIKKRQECMVSRLIAIGTKRMEELEKVKEETLRLVLSPDYTPVPGTLEALVWNHKDSDLPGDLLLAPDFNIDFALISSSLDQLFSLFPPLTKASVLPFP